MAIRIIPPDEAKKRAREKVAKWKREKTARAAKVQPDKTEHPVPADGCSQGNRKDLYRRLIEASREGKTDAVRGLLDEGLEADACDRTGWTALMAASQLGQRETAELLITRGADIDAKSYEGKTALMLASIKGHIEMVGLLLEKGADVNANSSIGFIDNYRTALSYALANEHMEVVELLKRYGAKE